LSPELCTPTQVLHNQETETNFKGKNSFSVGIFGGGFVTQVLTGKEIYNRFKGQYFVS
jgi:hypothetical protein